MSDWLFLTIVGVGAFVVSFVGLSWRHANNRLGTAAKGSFTEQECERLLKSQGIGFDPGVPYLISEASKYPEKDWSDGNTGGTNSESS